MNPRVLVIDDETALLPLFARYLRNFGLETTCVAGAEAARQAFSDTDHPFSFVICDLTLPDGQGENLAAEMLECSSELRVILMSGYPFSVDQMPDSVRDRVAFMQKPFLPSNLREIFEQWLTPPLAPAPSSAPADAGSCVQQSL